jgi:hypothetical protein
MSYYLSSYYSPYTRSLYWDSPYSWRYSSPYYSSYYPYHSRYYSPYWRSYAAPATEVRTTTVADDWPYSPAKTTTTTVERRSPVSPVYDSAYTYTTRDYDYYYPSYRSYWYDRPYYYGSRYYDYSPYSSYRTYYI